MKLRDRYPSLQDPAVVKAMVVRSVHASMALEDQTVPLARLEALYEHSAPTPPAGATKHSATPRMGGPRVIAPPDASL